MYLLCVIIDESLRPSDSSGPPVTEKVATLVNDKFSLIDLGLEKRKEIFEKTHAGLMNLFGQA
jgi:hypothetical protein